MAGSASTSVTVANSGQPTNIEVAGVPKLLKDTVAESLRLSTYSDRCDGKVIRLIFEFRIVGGPVASPRIVVWFHPPNKFSITTEPALPMP